MGSNVLERNERARKRAVRLEVTREVLWRSECGRGNWRRGRRQDGRRCSLKSLALLRGPEQEASNAAALGVGVAATAATLGSRDR